MNIGFKGFEWFWKAFKLGFQLFSFDLTVLYGKKTLPKKIISKKQSTEQPPGNFPQFIQKTIGKMKNVAKSSNKPPKSAPEILQKSQKNISKTNPDAKILSKN